MRDVIDVLLLLETVGTTTRCKILDINWCSINCCYNSYMISGTYFCLNMCISSSSSCSLILKIKLVPPSLPRSSYVPRPFGLYCSACFGSLFVSILCTCCSHFFWYCFISFTMFCTPVFCLIH